MLADNKIEIKYKIIGSINNKHYIEKMVEKFNISNNIDEFMFFINFINKYENEFMDFIKIKNDINNKLVEEINVLNQYNSKLLNDNNVSLKKIKKVEVKNNKDIEKPNHTTIERIICQLILGIYKCPINKSFNSIDENIDKIYLFIKLNNNKIKFSYNRSNQTKKIIALTQLSILNYKCVYCGENILINDKIVFSHNFGHNLNLNNLNLNFKRYFKDYYDKNEIFNSEYETQDELLRLYFKHHKI